MNRPVQTRGPGPLWTYSLIGLLCLIWGSTWLVIREGLRDLPPFSSAGIRFVVASLVFVIIAPSLARREGGARPPHWLSATMGTLNFAIPYGVVYWGETVIPSGLASVLWAVFPIFVAICGHFLLAGERLAPRHWFGFVLGFVGVVLLFLTDLRGLGAEAVGVGAVFLLSPLTAAIGNTIVKRHGGQFSSALLNRNGLIGGTVLLLTAALVFERGAELRWTGQAIFSVAYLATAGTVVTFGLYFWLLRHAAAHKLSLIAYVTPVIALTLGWAVGEEIVSRYTIGGTCLILVGVAMVIRRRRNTAEGSPTHGELGANADA